LVTPGGQQLRGYLQRSASAPHIVITQLRHSGVLGPARQLLRQLLALHAPTALLHAAQPADKPSVVWKHGITQAAKSGSNAHGVEQSTAL
jgi:hypothetical protein